MSAAIQAGWQSPGWINRLLLPVSALYGLLLWLRQCGWRLGLRRSQRLPVPVVVVGGITVGGVGKTPVVIELCRQLQRAGRRPGVISRGYGGRSPTWPLEVDGDSDAAMVGDEPKLIHEQAGVPLVVGPDRLASARLLLSRHPCDLIVSDDGFAHFRLERDLDIVVVDGSSGFGNGWLLPAGPLREPLSALARADLVLANGSRPEELPAHPHVEVFDVRPATLTNLGSGDSQPLDGFADHAAHAVAGLGNPGRFFSQLEDAGLRITRHAFPDHHAYCPGDLEFGDELPIVMTGKDAIKCREFPAASRSWVASAEVTLPPGVCAKVLAAAENHHDR